MTISLRSFLLAGVSSAALAGTSFAADMGAPIKAPPPVLPVFSWQGFYLGGDVGVGRLNANQVHFASDGACGTDENGHCQFEATGALAGVHAGYNFQSRYFVYGVEGDWEWTNLKETQFFGPPLGGNSGLNRAKVDWLASARLRAGLALDDTLVYLTGGIAFGGTKSGWGGGYVTPAGTCCFQQTNTRTGWVSGVGVEHMFGPNWSVRGEALYYDLGKQTITSTASSGTYQTEFSHEVFTGRLGVSYKW